MRLPNRKPGKYTFPTFDSHMTQAEFDSMQAKLERLKKVVRPEAIKETRAHGENGDFSENAEYQIAKGRLRGINRTIDELEFQIPRAIIIEAPEQNTTVQIGHTVTVRTMTPSDETNGEANDEANDETKEFTWKILGPKESDPTQGIISHVSPIGEALLGAQVGDVVSVQLPDRPEATVIKYTITKITI